MIAFIAFILTTLASVCIILWQLKHQQAQAYKATVRMLLSEVKENSRALNSGERFILTLDNSNYMVLLTLLGMTGLEGSISSEKLSHTKDPILSSELILLLRKMQLHNTISIMLHEHIGDKEPNAAYLIWLIDNLESKQKILKQDFAAIEKVLEREITQKRSLWSLIN